MTRTVRKSPLNQRSAIGEPGEPVKSGRNRWFVDSPLEGDGFELSVPREMGTVSSLRQRVAIKPRIGYNIAHIRRLDFD